MMTASLFVGWLRSEWGSVWMESPAQIVLLLLSALMHGEQTVIMRLEAFVLPIHLLLYLDFPSSQ